jgi:hypothetical protein
MSARARGAGSLPGAPAGRPNQVVPFSPGVPSLRDGRWPRDRGPRAAVQGAAPPDSYRPISSNGLRTAEPEGRADGPGCRAWGRVYVKCSWQVGQKGFTHVFGIMGELPALAALDRAHSLARVEGSLSAGLAVPSPKKSVDRGLEA